MPDEGTDPSGTWCVEAAEAGGHRRLDGKASWPSWSPAEHLRLL